MATGAAADGLFRPIFEGSISGFDHCVERRPYHRNCSCALHSKSKSGNNNNTTCTHKMPRCNNVSYPMRRAWSEGSLLVMAAASSSAHSSPSTSSPAHAAAGGVRSHRGSIDLEMGEEHHEI